MKLKSFVFCCVLSITYSSQAAQPPALVDVDQVVTQSMQQTVPVLGRLLALNSGMVAARTAGPVAEIAVEVGDVVEQGDVLAVLDQARLKGRVDLQQAEIKEAEAQRANALANQNLARKELARLEKIRNSPAFTLSLYDNQKNALEVARSSIQEAEAKILRGQANLHLARIELRDSTINAPYAGVITQRHTSLGAWLSLGDPVVSMVDDKNMEIQAELPGEYAQQVKIGVEVQFRLAANGEPFYNATLRAIIPEENPSSRTRPLRLQPQFDSSNPPPLAVNQSVLLRFPVQIGQAALTVHKDAVQHSPKGTIVFVVLDGKAQPRSVELGNAIANRLQVISGLQADEWVVIRGNERLRPGQAVQAKNQ